MDHPVLPVRDWLVGAIVAFLATVGPSARADVHDIVVEQRMVNFTGQERPAMTINGSIPGPVLRLKEGEDAVINVTNRMAETTSIHWHGLILSELMDGVPGVTPGFDGIRPGETFTYRFPVRQAGTYWFHSHTASQEQSGMYAPIVIEPQDKEPFRYDREYIIMFSDWTNVDPKRIINNLKVDGGYYNYNRQTLVSLLQDLGNAKSEAERQSLIDERVAWQRMRMDPTDIADVTGYTFLVNGNTPEQNFTALFQPGERVRLRFINAAAMTYFDVRIPGLKMTVVQADGNNVQPVSVDEFRMSVAETYDVIVQPSEDRAYTIVAESVDRSAFARATLAIRPGMIGVLPPHRPRAVLTMADMAMSVGPTGLDRGTLLPETDVNGHVAPASDMGTDGMSGMDMGGRMPGMEGSAAGPGRTGKGMAGMKGGSSPASGGHASPATHSGPMNNMKPAKPKPKAPPARPAMDPAMPGMSMAPGNVPGAWAQMPGMDMGGMDTGEKPARPIRGPARAPAKPSMADMPGMDAGAMAGPPSDSAKSHAGHDRRDAPHRGHTVGMAGMPKVSPGPFTYDTGAPPGAKVLSYLDLKALKPYPYKSYDRIIEIRLTGNMQRYFWSINGRKYSEAQPIVLRYGERARFRFINETMMNHPMHIHGTWMLPEVGHGKRNPKKHIVNIKPGTTLDVDIPADAVGSWAFHCHLLYHAETGMMRKVIVQRQSASVQ